MINMLPGGLAPLCPGQFAENGMFFVDHIGFGKTVHHAEQVVFFLAEIFGKSGHDKGFVRGQTLLPWLFIVQGFFEQGQDQFHQPVAFYGMGAQRHTHRYLQVGQHLGYIHLTPFPFRLGVEGIDTANDLLFNGGVE